MKTGALGVILIILLAILFIGSIKATVTIAYSDEVKLFVRVLFIKIKILPSKKGKRVGGMSTAKAEKIRKSLNKKINKKNLSAEEKKKRKAQKKESGEKKSVGDIISTVKLVSVLAVTVIEKFFKHLRIRIARIRITVASEDAATTAIAYGAVTQSLNILLPALESVKNFEKLKKADIAVNCDFASTEPEIDIKLGFSIRVWQVFHIALSALASLIKHKVRSLANADQVQNAAKEKTDINNK